MTKTLKQLLDAIDLPCPDGCRDLLITGVTDDSRKVQPGFLFAAYKGVEVDGHKYIPEAIRRGAAVVVTEGDWHSVMSDASSINGQLPIMVPNARRAFALLCAAWHDFPSRSLTLIGVTGTDGKTTTTNLLFSILRAAGHKTGMISTVNAVIGDTMLDTGLHVTTPDADEVQSYLAQMRDAGMTHCVLEVTSHGLAHHRVDGCDFDVAVVTNITHEHLNLHGTREAYREAKARLFEMARIHVLNADDDYSFSHLVRLPAKRRICYSRECSGEAISKQTSEVVGRQMDTAQNAMADGASYPFDWWLYPLRVDHTAGLIEVRVFKRDSEWSAMPLKTNLIGDYNVSNVLAAAGAALAVGAPMDAIQRSIADLDGIPGRMERIDEGQPYLAVVDFAHTPNALANVLAALRRITPGKLIAVFGCAGERDHEKRSMMGKAAAALADVAIFTAEDPRRESIESIFAEMDRGVADARPKIAEIMHIADRGEAIRRACMLARPGDTVVACGKGHEQSLCFGTTEYTWDDREAMRWAIHGKKLALGEKR